MISLRIIMSALVLFVLMAHVSAYWGNTGFFGRRNPRFRSSYYSPNYGYGLSSYNPSTSGRQSYYTSRSYNSYNYGVGGGGYYSDDMDDMYDNNYYGRGGWM